MTDVYLVERTDKVDYDETAGLVICATSMNRALEIARERLSDWPFNCRKIDNTEPEHVILEDYRA